VGQKQKRDSRSAKTGLTGPFGNFAKSPRNKKRRSTFEELLAKYKKRGATPKQKRWPNKAKDMKLSPGYCEQLDFFTREGNHAASPYPFCELVAPRFWPYSFYYSPLDYSRMHMQPYIIQYRSTSPNYGASQRPIIANNDLV